jgi:hypothetical protein
VYRQGHWLYCVTREDRLKWTWRHGDLDMEPWTWRHGHGHMGMDMDMDIEMRRLVSLLDKEDWINLNSGNPRTGFALALESKQTGG